LEKEVQFEERKSTKNKKKETSFLFTTRRNKHTKNDNNITINEGKKGKKKIH